MNKKEKAEMKEFISQKIDLGNGRYKDYEIEKLYDIATNPKKYDGQYEEYKNSFDDWCSDGKYHRDESTTYTLCSDDNSIRIAKHYQYKDDDGQKGEENSTIENGRDFINHYFSLFN